MIFEKFNENQTKNSNVTDVYKTFDIHFNEKSSRPMQFL